jgi:hypothetical protein
LELLNVHDWRVGRAVLEELEVELAKRSMRRLMIEVGLDVCRPGQFAERDSYPGARNGHEASTDDEEPCRDRISRLNFPVASKKAQDETRDMNLTVVFEPLQLALNRLLIEFKLDVVDRVGAGLNAALIKPDWVFHAAHYYAPTRYEFAAGEGVRSAGGSDLFVRMRRVVSSLS